MSRDDDERRFRAGIAALPPFTDDPVDRLRHVLAASAGVPDSEWVVQATYNAVAPGLTTGLTWGDLRAIAATYVPPPRG